MKYTEKNIFLFAPNAYFNKKHVIVPMIYIFDIDNTLYRASTVRTFLPAAFRERVLPVKIFLTLPWHFLRFLIFGVGPEMKGKKFWALKGIDKTKITDLAERTYREKIKPGLNKEMLHIIDKARRSGYAVVLATSSFYPLIEPLARDVHADAIIATDIDFQNGRSTGILRTLPSYREGKKIRVMEYLRSTGTRAEFCSFFTDHHDDLPLLRAVGRPVAVNPTRKLRRIALKEGWKILETD